MADNANALLQRRGQRGPTRGIDGRLYGPGFDTDPTGGTDSSPVQELYGSSWLDNVIKLYDNGMLHPAVMQMLEPQIRAMMKSQDRRGQGPDRQ